MMNVFDRDDDTYTMVAFYDHEGNLYEATYFWETEEWEVIVYDPEDGWVEIYHTDVPQEVT